MIGNGQIMPQNLLYAWISQELAGPCSIEKGSKLMFDSSYKFLKQSSAEQRTYRDDATDGVSVSLQQIPILQALR